MNKGEKVVDVTERRAYERCDIHRPLEYRCEKGAPADSSVTQNLSEAGALISTKCALKKGMRLIVKIALDGPDFFLRSRVARVERAGWGLYDVGIEFLDVSPDFMNKYYQVSSTHKQLRMNKAYDYIKNLRID